MRRDVAGWTGLLVILFVIFAHDAPAEDPSSRAAQAIEVERTESAPPSRALGPDEQALLAVRQEGQQRVAELAALLRDAVDPEARRQLERQVVETKKKTRLEFLRLKVEFARRDGDRREESLALALIEAIEHPPRPVPSMHVRPRPGTRGGQEEGSQ